MFSLVCVFVCSLIRMSVCVHVRASVSSYVGKIIINSHLTLFNTTAVRASFFYINVTHDRYVKDKSTRYNGKGVCERTRAMANNVATATAITTTTIFNIKTNFVMKMTEIEQMLASTAPDTCCLSRSLSHSLAVWELESTGIVSIIYVW